MIDAKVKVSFSLALTFLIASLVFVSAVTYSAGVSVGQFVRYGNFVGVGPGVESFNDYDWVKIEVTAVSGKEVTLLTTGQLKNGQAIPGNGNTSIWNIEAGTQNGVPSTLGPIIAANLNEGDAVPPVGTYSINKTENRFYLSVNRAVNIISSAIKTPDYNISQNYVYDKASGMLLEADSETVTQTQPPVTSVYSYSITETNIFGSGPAFPVQFLFLTVVIVVIIVAAVVAIALSGRRKISS